MAMKARDILAALAADPNVDPRFAKAVRVDHIFPPVPSRAFDWRASLEDYDAGDPLGHGRSPEAAVLDLADSYRCEICDAGACDRCAKSPGGDACPRSSPGDPPDYRGDPPISSGRDADCAAANWAAWRMR